ncbi:hypothetical protein BaRGS_00011894 [Batillaria attramentaria]|uniref:Uncharacterized protein n=1 Tax=Batillaria attramentaria TaxID=370345 RepID=A0ABD0LD59_9CAEN
MKQTSDITELMYPHIKCNNWTALGGTEFCRSQQFISAAEGTTTVTITLEFTAVAFADYFRANLTHLLSHDRLPFAKQARRLRELFKGRFSDAESRQLLADKGGLSEAVDFVLNGDPQVVRQFINTRNSELLRALQRDSENVHQALSHGVETCIRQFACGPCDRYWWRKVPERKQVSKCKGCRVRYDPVPKEQEWGLAEFKCWCGNSFWGSGWLGTQSPCYRCQSLTSPIRILPPTQPRNQKKKTEHSCTAPNCYNRTIAYPQPVPHPDDGGGYGAFWDEDPGEVDGFHVAHGGPPCEDGDVCAHARSQRRRHVLYPSIPHISTGSTVPTFLSQDEIVEEYGDIMSLPSIVEDDEASE